jgi:hypothetical protein
MADDAEIEGDPPPANTTKQEEDSFNSGREATGCITTYGSVKLAIVWVALQKKGETKLQGF